MDSEKNVFPLGLTFDDVLLLPSYSDFSRSDIDLSTRLTRNIKLSIPLVSSAMDTVTESKLAIALGKLGGIGIIHRNLTIADQVHEVKKVKKESVLVGGAVGAGKGFEDRIDALIKAKADVILVDSAHGFAKSVIDVVKFIKKKYKNIDVIGGNVATLDGAKALVNAGVDGLRVGMGPGAICSTRVISGMGVPQITAIQETAKAAHKANVPIIADGGIKYSGDMVKALAAGASTVMMGSFFAQAIESPGKIIKLHKNSVPKRFQNIIKDEKEEYLFKEYRGMGSTASMKRGASIKEEEFHGKDYKERVLVAEGVEGLVPVKGSVKDVVGQAIGGIKSGFYYTGVKNIQELWKKARFIQITTASLTESHPHSIIITNPGKNY
ncbi:MAG: Inosine-5-monophosphate dehydrogenase [uncultured bacterium]|nr:MAG: Inosine-5-monophosphate dehydrogenase [uncultured bacterium]OGH14453.1 MAG: hypothetical protein A2687_03570 [Candidatus Levybacteria bacterium RIFCSPHIGHO2_01_FULL_38_26]